MEANREDFRIISEFTSYEVSNAGQVRRRETGKIMKLTEGAYGYLVLNLYKDGKPTQKKVHNLVAEAFSTNPENKRTVDHIDANRKNNCITNLRFATHSENSRNMKRHADNSSVYKGVSLYKRRNMWVARIKFIDKHIYLGSFTSEKEAAAAYNAAAIEHYKEFARLNVFED